MKNILFVTAVIVLFFTAFVSTYVIVDPAGTGYLLGFLKEPIRPAGAQVMAMEVAKADAAAPKPAVEQKESPAATVRTAKTETRRPPTRAELEQRGEEQQVEIIFSRKGRYIGEIASLPAAPSTNPPAELYPFSVTRRTFPDSKTISVELAIKNSSGVHWKTGYVYLKSPGFQSAQQFEITDWQLDEIVGLEYSFPRGEVRERVNKLKVMAVAGEPRKSALAEQVSQSRRQGIERALLTRPAESGSRNSREGDSLEAPGLLGFLGQAQEPLTGIQVALVSPQVATEQRLELEIPEELRMQRDLIPDIRETNDERQNVARLVREFHKAGVQTEDSLDALVKDLTSKSYREAMRTTAREVMEDLRIKVKNFNDLGVELAMAIQRSRDSEVAKAEAVLKEHSESILGQIEEIERRVRIIDPQFAVQ